MTELKPCPFCGGEAEIEKDMFGKWHIDVFFVKCKNCGVQTKKERYKADAIYKWNRR